MLQSQAAVSPVHSQAAAGFKAPPPLRRATEPVLRKAPPPSRQVNDTAPPAPATPPVVVCNAVASSVAAPVSACPAAAEASGVAAAAPPAAAAVAWAPHWHELQAPVSVLLDLGWPDFAVEENPLAFKNPGPLGADGSCGFAEHLPYAVR